jgi:hypothetical protein
MKSTIGSSHQLRLRASPHPADLLRRSQRIAHGRVVWVCVKKKKREEAVMEKWRTSRQA